MSDASRIAVEELTRKKASSESQSAPQVSSPGALQRALGNSRTSVLLDDAEATAREGIGGAPSPLPHLEEIAQAFGPAIDVRSIRAHLDSDAARASHRLGAEAYTLGRDVAFAAPPSVETAAHEAAHAARSALGATERRGLSSPADAAEREADSVAKRVAGGGGASPILTADRGTVAAISRQDAGTQPASAPPPPDLNAQFQQQLTAPTGPNYDAAALTLNGMSTADIEDEVRALDTPTLVGLFKGAMRTMLLWPPPNRVADAIQQANLPAAREGRIEFFNESLAASHYREAALALNGFSDPDIRLMLTNPPLSAAQLTALRDAANQYMAGWNGRVVGPIHDILEGLVANQMGTMVGQRGTWVPSGPTSGDTFASWAMASTQGPAPVILPSTTINCWEAVLLAAYQIGDITWQWIHDLYAATGVGDWGTFLVNRLTPQGRTMYTSGSGPQPQRGQIVVFNGAAHVAIATGSHDSSGRVQVYSFWPPPGLPSYRGTVDAVKITTIEELVTYMTANFGPVLVEFGEGPW